MSNPKVIKAWAVKDERFGVHIRDMHSVYDDCAIHCRGLNLHSQSKRELFFPVPVEIRELTGADANKQYEEEEVDQVST